jgi:hypothetical protein
MDRLFLPNRSGDDAVFVDQGLVDNGGGPANAPPFLAGELTAPVVGTNSFTLAWPPATDDVGVATYEVSLDGGATWGDVGNVLNATFGGRQPATTYQTRVRARDSGNLVSAALALAVITKAIINPPDEVETAARFARPYADVATGNWLPSQAGATLASMIDEPNPKSSDFIYAPEPNPNAYCEIRLGPVKDPESSAGQKVRYQVWDEGAGGMVVRLMQGAAMIARWDHPVLPTTPTEFAQALTPIQCDSITDYTDLRLRFEAQ